MKILFITSRFPLPIDKGDKLRVYNQIKVLSKYHDVYLFALSSDKIEKELGNELLGIVKKIEVIKLNRFLLIKNLIKGVFSKVPFQTALFYSKKHQSILDKFISDVNPDILFFQLIRTAEYKFNSKHQNILSYFDYIDVLSKGLHRRASKARFPLKYILEIEYSRVLAYEKFVHQNFNQSIIITQNDKDLLPVKTPNSIKVIPNGIDINYYSPLKTKKDIDILFCGNMGYPPNITAVEYFVNNIYPKILLKRPNTNFYIVGSEPTAKIKRLNGLNNIVVTGWVDDIREYYSRAKIFVAPMQIGTGLQNKILEAMSMELPTVISSLAQKGIKAQNMENCFISDSSTEFCGICVDLLDNDGKIRIVGNRAREFVSDNYSWKIITSIFEKDFF